MPAVKRGVDSRAVRRCFTNIDFILNFFWGSSTKVLPQQRLAIPFEIIFGGLKLAKPKHQSE